MAWLMLLAALACFAMAILLPLGTGVVLLVLVAALVLLLAGTTRRLRHRVDALSRSQSRMLDEPEVARLREQIAASGDSAAADRP
jgi:membrane protein implicated in regulation of membrane protease activity